MCDQIFITVFAVLSMDLFCILKITSYMEEPHSLLSLVIVSSPINNCKG